MTPTMKFCAFSTHSWAASSIASSRTTTSRRSSPSSATLRPARRDSSSSSKKQSERRTSLSSATKRRLALAYKATATASSASSRRCLAAPSSRRAIGSIWVMLRQTSFVRFSSLMPWHPSLLHTLPAFAFNLSFSVILVPVQHHYRCLLFSFASFA